MCNSDDVQWHWTLLSTCIESENHAIELLRKIVTLTVTIRGFALAASWLEVYKLETRKTTKKSSGLRKNFPRMNNCNDTCIAKHYALKMLILDFLGSSWSFW